MDNRESRHLIFSWSCSGTALNFRHNLGIRAGKGSVRLVGCEVLSGQGNIVAGSVNANTLQFNAVSTSGAFKLTPVESASIEGGYGSA